MTSEQLRTERRVLIVCPSWVGDAVMATPALRRIRRALPGYFLGALVRPGIDQVLESTGTASEPPLIDEFHVERGSGVMGPKRSATKVRSRRYQTALLLTNSFSTALATRIAGIPRRIGFDRDGRGLLLTDRLQAPRRADGSWAVVPAVDYYHTAADALLRAHDAEPASDHASDNASDHVQDRPPMELGTTEADEREATRILTESGIDLARPIAILNPGGNNPAKRWPAERYAQLADALASNRGLSILLNGSPNEAELIAEIAGRASCDTGQLPTLGLTLKSLKAVVKRCRLMVTNDTGPRHFAAALGVPVVSLFGPTDHRWTTIPTRPAPDGSHTETILLADPNLEAELGPDALANDHPDRCAIEHIGFDRVHEACQSLLDRTES